MSAWLAFGRSFFARACRGRVLNPPPTFFPIAPSMSLRQTQGRPRATSKGRQVREELLLCLWRGEFSLIVPYGIPRTGIRAGEQGGRVYMRSSRPLAKLVNSQWILGIKAISQLESLLQRLGRTSQSRPPGLPILPSMALGPAFCRFGWESDFLSFPFV
jgi:hypothetical protein